MGNNAARPDGSKRYTAKNYAPDLTETSSPAKLPTSMPYNSNENQSKLRGVSLPTLATNHEDGYGKNQETSVSGNTGSVIHSPTRHRRGPMPDAEHFAPPDIDISANGSPSVSASGQSKSLPRTSAMSYAAVVSKPPPPPVSNDVRVTQKLGNNITNGQRSGSANSHWYTGRHNTAPKDRTPSNPFPNTTKKRAKDGFRSYRRGNSSENKSPYRLNDFPKESPKNLPRTEDHLSVQKPNHSLMTPAPFNNQTLLDTLGTGQFTGEAGDFQQENPTRRDASTEGWSAESTPDKQKFLPMHVSPAAPVRSPIQPSQTRGVGSRKEISSDTSLEDFQRRYPKTGRSDIQELQRELTKHPKGSAGGFAKIDAFIIVVDQAITARLLRVEQKRLVHAPGLAKYEETTNTEVKGLEEKKLQVQAIREEFSLTRPREDSMDGSFVTAREHVSDDSSEYKAAHTCFSHPVVRLPPSESPRPPSQPDHAEGAMRGVGEWTGEDVPSSSQMTISFSSDSHVSSTSADQVAHQNEPAWNESGRATDDPKQNFDRRSSDESLDADILDSTQKKALNFDSPAFTPAGMNNGTPRANHPTLSSQAAAAAPFTPRGIGALTPNPSAHQESDPMSSLNIASIREFQPFDGTSSQTATNGAVVEPNLQYDAFQMGSVAHAMPTPSYNPFMEESNGIAPDPMSTYYTAQSNYVPPAQPLLYHLYAPQGPHREDLLPYQRQPHEFFIPEKLRESFQRRAEATLQVMPNSQLPAVDPFHSLVALDTNQHQNTQLFGYPTWIYKALSQKNGKYYCLRRLEGYRPTNDRAIRSVKDWRRIDGTHVVKIHDAFTTRAFGDSSLVIVTDYHPLSKTLSELHLATRSRIGPKVDEAILWSYIVQISLALKEIHKLNLAARCIDPSKVILTDKNRIRLNGCAVLDVIQFDAARPLIELQQEDFQNFGRLIISIATHTPVAQLAPIPSLDQLARDYSSDLVEIVKWLIQPPQSPTEFKTIPTLLQSIAVQTADVLSKLYSGTDIYTSEFFRELENSRLTRLLLKLNTVNERPEYAHNSAWSETGERYLLGLMRDHIFHQVDDQNRPSLDLGWMLGCLNKLDAGSEEKVELVSRDGANSFVVSWRELRGLVARSFGELMGGGSGGSGVKGKR